MQSSRRMVHLTMASLPSRLAGLRPLTRAIAGQTRVPDTMTIWMCPFYRRLGAHFSLESLPSFLSRHEFLRVELTPDRGPATKILPFLAKPVSPDDILIIMDDDRLPPAEFVATLVEHASRERAAFGYRGRCLTPSLRYADSTIHGIGGRPTPSDGVDVEILTVTGGVALRRELLDGFLEYWADIERTVPEELLRVDDIWLAAYFAGRGIPCRAVPLAGDLPLIDFHNPTWKRAMSYLRRRHPPKPGTPPDALWAAHEESNSNDRALIATREVWIARMKKTS